MEVYVRGSRSSAQEWLRAQEIPANELPSLDDEQKAAAKRENVSEEDYARSAYAGALWQEKTLRNTLHFARWLNAKIQERASGFQLDSITLDTWRGRYEVRLQGEEPVELELDEDLVEKYLTTGAAELERAIFRVLDVYLPQGRVARAS